jgi:hypothetical protein
MPSSQISAGPKIAGQVNITSMSEEEDAETVCELISE